MTNLISFRNANSVKAIFILLLWQVVNDLLYVLYLKLSAIMSSSYGSSYIWIISLEAAASVVYPIAGFLADAVYGRYKILKYSSFALVGINTGNLFMLIIIPIMKLHTTALICDRICENPAKRGIYSFLIYSTSRLHGALGCLPPNLEAVAQAVFALRTTTLQYFC